MKQLDDYFAAKQAVHDAFGYKSDWVEIPLEDYRQYFWYLDGDTLIFAKKVEELPLTEEAEETGAYYSNPMYKQRFLSKWVYETEGFTMICVNTETDGNKFLAVLDNMKKKNNE